MTSIDVHSNAAPSDVMTAKAVRTRARMIFDVGTRGELAHFALHLDALPACAAYVAETIRQNYPDLKVPPHSRWRHLSANGRPWAEALGQFLSRDTDERARQRFDLAFVSVLLDAGAGPDWRWRDPVTGKFFGKSEGLALASLEAFKSGCFSSVPGRPCQADATGLENTSARRLADCFQVTDENPMVGFLGRVSLLRRLGKELRKITKGGARARPGNIYDAIARDYSKDYWTLMAEVPRFMEFYILTHLCNLWPLRISIPGHDGLSAGDTWRHPAVKFDDASNGLVPFHKLSQWLTYSLIEPLQEAGIEVRDLDGLTGLAEYRNGGLFIDMGVIAPRDPTLLTRPMTPDQEPIVEWRALTVALLDEIAPLVRAELGVTAQQMPLASILEGGTWAAGRRIAKEKRTDGGPPLNIVSDGTVF